MSKPKSRTVETVNILLTLDKNYLQALPAMLKSLFLNNPGEKIHVHLVHEDMSPEDLEPVDRLCARHLAKLIPLRISGDRFRGAPVNYHYSRAMYYRLLAFELLPASLDRILYLDPDVLVINRLAPLYTQDISRHLYAAAAHTGLTNISTYVNQFRLNTFDAEYYYNSGVILMNLAKLRREEDGAKVFDYVAHHGNELILPDQDVFNALYGRHVLPLDDGLYNYDSRRFEAYLLKSGGEMTMDWVMRNTVVLHFCGKRKPWHETCGGRFASLYKHYMRLAGRQCLQVTA